MITQAEILRRYGLVGDAPYRLIEPVRSESDGLWRIGFYSDGDPHKAIGIDSAVRLTEELRAAGFDAVAEAIEKEVERARRYSAA